MKGIFTKLILCALLVSGIVVKSNGQINLPVFENIIQGGGEDMSTYMNNYIAPFMNSFGTGIDNGWYNTAAPHESLGFDLTFYVSAVAVPTADKIFTFNESEYNALRLASGASTAELPTLMGGATDDLLVSTFTDPTLGPVSSPPFDAPPGFGEDLPANYVPVPMVQLAVGVVKKTELILRYAPTVTFGDDFEMTFFGIGVKHDFGQWIPGLKGAPVDLSVLLGYTNLNTTYSFGNNPVIQTSPDAEAAFDAGAFTFQVLASKQISVLTIYGGIGFNSVSSKFKMSGSYGYQDVSNPSVIVFVDDPVDLKFPLSGPRATLGFRLKVAVFALNVDYTLQKYNTITLGFGINVR